MKKVKNYKLKKLTKFLKPCIKLEKTIIKFGDIKIKIKIFHQYKRPISIDNIDVKQQFLRRSLLTSIDLNVSLATRILKKLELYSYFFQKGMHIEEILIKFNEIWENVTNIIHKEFDTNPIYNEKYIKPKIKVHNKKVNTNFHGNKMPDESLECVCLSITLLDSVYRKDNKYYPQVFLEECQYIVKEKKIYNCIIEDVEISFDEEDLLEKIQMDKNSDYEENSDEDIMEKVQMEKSSDEEN